MRGRGSRRATQCVAPTEGSLGGLCRGGFETRPYGAEDRSPYGACAIRGCGPACAHAGYAVTVRRGEALPCPFYARARLVEGDGMRRPYGRVFWRPMYGRLSQPPPTA